MQVVDLLNEFVDLFSFCGRKEAYLNWDWPTPCSLRSQGESMFRYLAWVLLIPVFANAGIEDFNDLLDQAEVEHMEIAEQVEGARRASASEKPEEKMIRIMDDKGQERVVAGAPSKYKSIVKKKSSGRAIKRSEINRRAIKKKAINKVATRNVERSLKKKSKPQLGAQHEAKQAKKVIKKLALKSKYKKRQPSHVLKQHPKKSKFLKSAHKPSRDKSSLVAAP